MRVYQLARKQQVQHAKGNSRLPGNLSSLMVREVIPGCVDKGHVVMHGYLENPGHLCVCVFCAAGLLETGWRTLGAMVPWGRTVHTNPVVL